MASMRIMPLLTAIPINTIKPSRAIGPACELSPVPVSISAQHEPIAAVGRVQKISSGEAKDSKSEARTM